MIIDFRPTVYTIQDPANRDIQARDSSKQISLAMFPAIPYAAQAAERIIRFDGYPSARIRFKANRNVYALKQGDLFTFSYAPRGISNMVCRVEAIREEGLESEEFVITAVEAVEYLSAELDVPAYWQAAAAASGGLLDPAGPVLESEPEDTSLDALTETLAVEAPYELSGEDVRVVLLAGRETLRELGFAAYLGLSASSYSLVDTAAAYPARGEIDHAYEADTGAIDEKRDPAGQVSDAGGLLVTFDNADKSLVQTINRAEALTGRNLALIGGTELVAFQTAVPVSGNQYRLTGVVRGLYDTEPQDHAGGAEFWFLGSGRYGLLDHDQLTAGATRYFKMVPFSEDRVGDLADASAESLALDGRAFKPYKPGGFTCNDGGNYPIYAADCVLSWTPRVRTGPGAGLRPESSTDASPTWEGYFEVRVYSGETLLRTVTGIDGRTWTYTAAMRADDGAGDVDLTFKLRNYLTTGGAAYASDWEEITVRYNTAAGPDYTALTTQAGEELMTEAGEFLITEE